MSIHKSTEVWATSPSGAARRRAGWLYTLAEIENFLRECREAGIKENERVIVANYVGQLHAKVTR